MIFALLTCLYVASFGYWAPTMNTLALVLDDATHDEAAEVLGISPGTVSWRISEAKKRLRSLRETEDQI